MVPTPPFIACRIRDNLPDEVARLSAALASGGKASQAEVAGRLITEASCDILDAFFGDMIAEMMEKTGDPGFREAHAMIQEVKAKLHQYLGWITGFFSNERLAPVVKHYQSLMVHLPVADGELTERAHLAFAISPALAREAQAALTGLRDPATADIKAGVEVLIRVIEEALEPLLYVPKQRMKFNLVVDKTLNGFIVVTKTLVFRSFRKLGVQLPQSLYIPVADHLESFLYPIH